MRHNETATQWEWDTLEKYIDGIAEQWLHVSLQYPLLETMASAAHNDSVNSTVKEGLLYNCNGITALKHSYFTFVSDKIKC